MSDEGSAAGTAQPRRPSAGAARPPRSPAAAKPARHAGPLDPRAVPCSMLGVKDIHGARTMGPPSGAELVSPSKRLAPHEKEQRLPQRESSWVARGAAAFRGQLRCASRCHGPVPHLQTLCRSRKAGAQGAAQGAAGPGGATPAAPPARLHLHKRAGGGGCRAQVPGAGGGGDPHNGAAGARRRCTAQQG